MARCGLGIPRHGASLTTSILDLTLEESVELGHAWLQSVADRLGIRVLFIKGPSLHRQGLREQRVSGDIDVLVDPESFAELCAAIVRAGWDERPSNFISRRTTLHSKTYLHHAWPCDLDVHSFYPGFLASPAEVFEALWERREGMPFAGRTCWVPDRAAGVLILALHSLRGSTTQERHEAELQDLLRAELTDSERWQVAELAARTGSLETLADLLPALGIPVPNTPPPTSSPELRMWRERVAAGSHGSYFWLATLRTAPWPQRSVILWGALWPTRHDLLVARPETTDTVIGRGRARIARLGRGARSLPRALQAIFTHRGR